MNTIKSVLFVCTGNSCRSVMAEGLLKKRLDRIGRRDVEVRSAGISAINGLAPTEETIDAMKAEGIDISGYRSKRVTELLIKKSDLILVMSEPHLKEVLRMSPEAAPKTHLLKKFGLNASALDSLDEPEISDPIGRSCEFYKHTLDELKSQTGRIADFLWPIKK